MLLELARASNARYANNTNKFWIVFILDYKNLKKKKKKKNTHTYIHIYIWGIFMFLKDGHIIKSYNLKKINI